MPNLHAYLSASSAHRWMRCTRSPNMCADIQERASPYAKEGTDAHSLCEYKVLTALGREANDPTPNLDYFDEVMDECSDEYRNLVMEQYAEAKERCADPIILIEERLDFSKWVPEAFGTADCLIIADDSLTVIDFKYGMNVLVNAEDNPQMMCYALGAVDTYGSIYDIKNVRMCIFQPRRDHVSIAEITVEELLKWATEELAPKAKLAYNGEGEFVPGEHCMFCNANAVCRARADYNLELAEYELTVPDKLSEDEIAAILGRIDELTSWANDVKEYALCQALAGTNYPGFKIVEGRSTRKYTDEDAVAKVLIEAGHDPYEKKVKGITALTKELGKNKFAELLEGLIYKPPGKPVLAPESDKRQTMNILDELEE